MKTAATAAVASVAAEGPAAAAAAAAAVAAASATAKKSAEGTATLSYSQNGAQCSQSIQYTKVSTTAMFAGSIFIPMQSLPISQIIKK